MPISVSINFETMSTHQIVKIGIAETVVIDRI